MPNGPKSILLGFSYISNIKGIPAGLAVVIKLDKGLIYYTEGYLFPRDIFFGEQFDREASFACAASPKMV